MKDHDAAIARQSGRPLEEHERRQVRYLLERFWSSKKNQQKVRRAGAWVGGAIGLALTITQLIPAIAGLLKGIR